MNPTTKLVRQVAREVFPQPAPITFYQDARKDHIRVKICIGKNYKILPSQIDRLRLGIGLPVFVAEDSGETTYHNHVYIVRVPRTNDANR